MENVTDKLYGLLVKKGNEENHIFKKIFMRSMDIQKSVQWIYVRIQENTVHVMRQMCTRQTDIFLFDIPQEQYLDTENYKILESIKDGAAMAGKYMSKKLIFRKPNVVMVFSNKAPNKSKLSEDRWRIFKISKDIENLVENGLRCGNSKGDSFHAPVDEDSVDEGSDSVNGCSDSEY